MTVFCRWSTKINENMFSDILLYDDLTGNFHLHVTDCRVSGKQTYEPIDLPFCGETWHDIELSHVIELLTQLKELSYQIPNDLIERINHEA